MDSKELRLFREAYGSIFEGYSKNKKEKGCVDKEESEMEEGGEKEEYKGKKKEKKEMEESVSDPSNDVTASERLDEAEGPALPGEPGRPGTPKAPGGRPHLPGEKQTPAPKKPGMTLQLAGADLFDIVKGHLMSEGYADTEEAAIAIMANMSEEWRQSILSEDPVQDFRDMRRAAENKGGARGPELSHGPDVKTAQPVKPGTSNSATIKPEPRSREFSHGGPGQKKASSSITRPTRGVPDFVERRARG